MELQRLVLFVIIGGVVSEDNSKISPKRSTPWTLEKELLTLRAKVAEQDTKICEMEKDIMELSHKVVSIAASHPGEDGGDSAEKKRTASSKTTFTVWGRTDCPSNVSEIVYSGYTGGSSYIHTGGAVEYVCLPPDPTWGPYKNIAVGSTGYMYGSEYQSLPDATLQDKKVPCAVCLARSFATSIMITARTSCYPGWTPAYDGQLSSGYYGHKASSQYICLSSSPQGRDDKENHDGKLIYFVKTVCGSLPCPPYEDNKLLSCVVCLI